jgi:hypothetical protein
MGKAKKSKQADVWNANTVKKTMALGECYHKARRTLIAEIVRRFFAGDDGKLHCVRCGEEIDGEYHIDHKEPWLFSLDPKKMFFDIKNIGLSHPICNSLARRNHRQYTPEEAALRSVIKHRMYQQRHYARKKKLRDRKPREINDTSSK